MTQIPASELEFKLTRRAIKMCFLGHCNRSRDRTAAVGTFSVTSLPRSGSSSSSSNGSSASSYSRDQASEHSLFESYATATNTPTCTTTEQSALIRADMTEVKAVINVSTGNIEKMFTTIESKLGTVEAAVKELSSIVKTTSFSIKGSVYEGMN